MRLRRGNLDAVAATPVSKDSLATTGLPRCARNDTFPATLNSYDHLFRLQQYAAYGNLTQFKIMGT